MTEVTPGRHTTAGVGPEAHADTEVGVAAGRDRGLALDLGALLLREPHADPRPSDDGDYLVGDDDPDPTADPGDYHADDPDPDEPPRHEPGQDRRPRLRVAVYFEAVHGAAGPRVEWEVPVRIDAEHTATAVTVRHRQRLGLIAAYLAEHQAPALAARTLPEVYENLQPMTQRDVALAVGLEDKTASQLSRDGDLVISIPAGLAPLSLFTSVPPSAITAGGYATLLVPLLRQASIDGTPDDQAMTEAAAVVADRTGAVRNTVRKHCDAALAVARHPEQIARLRAAWPLVGPEDLLKPLGITHLRVRHTRTDKRGRRTETWQVKKPYQQVCLMALLGCFDQRGG